MDGFAGIAYGDVCGSVVDVTSGVDINDVMMDVGFLEKTLN